MVAMENTSAIDEQLHQRIMQCMQTGDRQALASMLENYVRQRPASASFALLFVAAQLAQNGQYADAIPLYIQALRLEPKNPLIYFYLGLAYHGLNLRPECHRIWDELPKRFPDHPIADYQSALRLIDDNRTQEAKLLLEQAIRKLDEASPVRIQIMSTLNVLNAE